jgi:Ca2+-binding EF-hand superfamily protein
MRNLPAFVVASIAAVCGATDAYGAAPTQSPSSNANVSFDALDKNSDGKISLNEASDNDALFVAFKSLDKNKDGELSKEEFAAYQQARTGA